MNTYAKFCPNVFVAKCDAKHERGEEIEVETKHGAVHDCIVYNLVKEVDGYYYYSIVRSDGYNYQQRAQQKADRYDSWAASANKKAERYMEASRKNDDFLTLGEPIKVGHSSEKAHRKMIDDAWRNTGKAVEQFDKAEEHTYKAEYWEKKAQEVNLSLPESLEYYKSMLEKAIEYHTGLKSGKYPREHSYSLTYAKNAVNDLTKKVELATRLWGE